MPPTGQPVTGGGPAAAERSVFLQEFVLVWFFMVRESAVNVIPLPDVSSGTVAQ